MAVQLGTDIQIVDLNTGKLTRQGLLFFQNFTATVSQSDTTTTGLANHIALAATASQIGHVLEGAAVTDAVASTVDVTSPDAIDAATNLVLSNETKADVNQLVTDLNAVVSQLNALLSSLRAAGIIST